MVTNKTDFSDLQITSEFDNRSGTERFLRIFSCVVTYRTGAGQCLYMITTPNAYFTQMKRMLTWNDVYIDINIRHHSSEETAC